MIDKGNYFYCPACKTLDFKLSESEDPWRPLPRQQKFLYQEQRHGLYVGGIGSGKTMSGAYKAIFKAIAHPNGQGLIGAQTFPQLRDATMKTFFEVCPEALMKDGSKQKAFNKSESILTMKNGHEILFRQLDDESKLRSLNLVWFWIDEASEVTPDIFYQLQSRLRSRFGFKNGKPAHQGWVTTNPAGRDWLWKEFVAQEDPDFFWINAPTRENIYLPENFEANLRRRWSENWIRRFLEGSFDVFEGQIYPMLDIELHGTLPSVVALFFDDAFHQVPAGWPVYVCLDHGVTNPTAVGFYTLLPDGTPFKFDEHCESYKPVSYHAFKIREKLASWGVDPENVVDWLIDPSTKGQRGMEGRAVMSEYHDQGIPFRPANNQVQAGILQVTEYLMPDPVSGRANFFIHRRCSKTYLEMGGYKWKPQPATAITNEPEEPVKKDDHTCDETRYFLMSRPKITLMKPTNPYELWQKNQAGIYQLTEASLPYALRSNSNWNGSGSGTASSAINW